MNSLITKFAAQQSAALGSIGNFSSLLNGKEKISPYRSLKGLFVTDENGQTVRFTFSKALQDEMKAGNVIMEQIGNCPVSVVNVHERDENGEETDKLVEVLFITLPQGYSGSIAAKAIVAAAKKNEIVGKVYHLAGVTAEDLVG